MGKAARREPGLRWGEIRIVLTDDLGSAAIHDAWMGLPTPTDVLTQRYDPLPGERAAYAGDIVVNIQRAFEIGPEAWPRVSARSAANGPCRELALYIAHGCDHLTGASDKTPAGRRRMRQRELGWLRAAETAGLLAHLARGPRPAGSP